MELKINYPPNFRSRYGRDCPNARHIEAILHCHLPGQRQFLKDLNNYHDELANINVEEPEESLEPRWSQPWLPPLDGVSLYGAIAIRRPKTYLEIGSGNSTKFVARAIRDLGLDTRIISVDPQPRAEIDELADLVIRTPLEETDLGILDELTPQDVVFFDGSHRCLQISDVTVFFIEVLPQLAAGALIGIHDIFWPLDYPPKWISRYYSEQYVLGAYMVALGNRFPCVFSSAYMGTQHGDEVKCAMPSALLKRLNEADLGFGGGCLWFEKPDTQYGTWTQ